MHKKLSVTGLILILLGSFLPWVTVSLFGMKKSLSGLEGDGVITLMFALVGGAIYFLVKHKIQKLTPLITGILTLLVGGYAFFNLENAIGNAGSLFNNVLKTGIGLYLVLIGSIVLIIGGVFELKNKDSKKEEEKSESNHPSQSNSEDKTPNTNETDHTEETTATEDKKEE